MSGRLVVLAAGGSGGHIFPAEALARELLARGRPVAVVTDLRGAVFAVKDVTTYRVPAGRSGPGLRAKVQAAADVARGVFAATRLLKRIEPGCVVGFGGYPSFPGVMAAVRQQLPTVIHEQNAVLGRANRMLAPRVTRIATTFDQVSGLRPADLPKVVRTGTPVRPAIAALRGLHYDPPEPAGDLRLLVIGGSQGARVFSEVVPSAVGLLPPAMKQRIMLSQQVRPENASAAAAELEAQQIKAETRPFFEDLPERLGQAHLVVCRSGGSTLAELTAVGRPAILVPYAAALADEQTANAQQLVERGAAWLLPERELTPPALAGLLQRLLNEPQSLARAAAEAHALGEPAAAVALADVVEQAETEHRR